MHKGSSRHLRKLLMSTRAFLGHQGNRQGHGGERIVSSLCACHASVRVMVHKRQYKLILVDLS